MGGKMEKQTKKSEVVEKLKREIWAAEIVNRARKSDENNNKNRAR